MNSVLLLVLQETDQLSWARDVIQKQYDLAIISIFVVVAVASIAAAASWFTNQRLIKSDLKLAKNELNNAIESFQAETRKTMTDIKETFNKQLVLIKADKARLFALIAHNAEMWDSEVMWLGVAVRYYAETGEDSLLRNMVDFLDQGLKKCNQLEAEELEPIKTCVAYIPDILTKEKKRIQQKIDELSTS